MIVAHADDGRLIILGVDKENVRRLTKRNQPIRVSKESHPGYPLDATIVILYADTLREIAEQLKPFMDSDTKIVTVPPPTESKPS